MCLVLSGTAFAQGGRDNRPDNPGPHAGPKSEAPGNSAFGRSHNPNTNFDPKHGHDKDGPVDLEENPRGAPSSGDGEPEGSGWDGDEVPGY